jgi:hypothetical protein
MVDVSIFLNFNWKKRTIDACLMTSADEDMAATRGFEQ